MPAGNTRPYIGIMSGTSLDAIDAVLLHLDENGRGHVSGAAAVELPLALREELLALHVPGTNELDRAARASIQLAHLYADAALSALSEGHLEPAQIVAIGVHGQTIRHRPDAGYTLQLNAPALIAELTGIDVIADFRSRDIAAGGQGAPLVPAFHAGQFGSTQTRVVLNLGGIANVTILEADGTIRGFDTGPANMLMDAWTSRHLGRAYDADGRWAHSGRPLPALLERMLTDPWFELAPPKSTGRDDFNLEWLDRQLTATFGEDPGRHPAAADIQATLLQLTAQSIATAIRRHAADTKDVLVCGGGIRNTALMSALREQLPCPVDSTERHGLPPQWVEAAAFAWLAWCHDTRTPAGLPAVTGARRPTILGCRYLA